MESVSCSLLHVLRLGSVYKEPVTVVDGWRNKVEGPYKVFLYLVLVFLSSVGYSLGPGL